VSYAALAVTGSSSSFAGWTLRRSSPVLSFGHRKEIALAIRYVEEVIECKWLIDEAYLNFHNIDLLVHGDDNVNPVPPERLVLFPRTGGISSTVLSNRGDS
jgi:glycerol-3-phosphate cytidylyltransferase